MLDRNLVTIHGALALLLAIHIVNEVARAIRPRVCSRAVLLSLLPGAFEAFTIWVVDNAGACTLVKFEIAFVHLAVGPHVSALALLLPHVESTVVEPAIGPLEEAFALHRVVLEGALVDFALRCNTPTETIDLPFLEEAFKDGVVRIDFETDAVWFEVLLADLTSELCSTLAAFEIVLHYALCVHIIVSLAMSIVIEGSQDFVYVPHCLITDTLHHVVVIFESEGVV